MQFLTCGLSKKVRDNQNFLSVTSHIFLTKSNSWQELKILTLNDSDKTRKKFRYYLCLLFLLFQIGFIMKTDRKETAVMPILNVMGLEVLLLTPIPLLVFVGTMTICLPLLIWSIVKIVQYKKRHRVRKE